MIFFRCEYPHYARAEISGEGPARLHAIGGREDFRPGAVDEAD